MLSELPSGVIVTCFGPRALFLPLVVKGRRFLLQCLVGLSSTLVLTLLGFVEFGTHLVIFL